MSVAAWVRGHQIGAGLGSSDEAFIFKSSPFAAWCGWRKGYCWVGVSLGRHDYGTGGYDPSGLRAVKIPMGFSRWAGRVPRDSFTALKFPRAIRFTSPTETQMVIWEPGWKSLRLGFGAWVPVVVFGLTTYLLWRELVLSRRIRQLANRCRKCGYDLTGNVSGVCPECGATTRHYPASVG